MGKTVFIESIADLTFFPNFFLPLFCLFGIYILVGQLFWKAAYNRVVIWVRFFHFVNLIMQTKSLVESITLYPTDPWQK